jgi:hypothetical protein
MNPLVPVRQWLAALLGRVSRSGSVNPEPVFPPFPMPSFPTPGALQIPFSAGLFPPSGPGTASVAHVMVPDLHARFRAYGTGGHVTGLPNTGV